MFKPMVFPLVMYGDEIGPERNLRAKELMLFNSVAGEESLESLGQQGDEISQS